ncbi:hybrid sensor histidine kinase/response regulator [Paludisphaera soli]|uniref:hybrid sensor histidine kinase/response regulator n=1 Tax=Paludisphaera soli TaxID=2712865 RepID=UPI0013ED2A74|nr:PAS domain S-box protein [Paludisphaera soli]
MQGPEPTDPEAASSGGDAARFRALFDNGLVAMDLVDGEGRWVDLNGRLCAMLGGTRAELAGRRVEEFTHPEDVERERSLSRRLFAGEGRSYRMEKRLRRVDGGWARVELEATLVVDAGAALRASIFREAGGPSRADEDESRARALMDQSPLAVVVIDPETGRFLEFNEPAHEELGYTRREFAELTAYDVYADAVREALADRIAVVLETGGGRFESSHRTRGGGLRRVSVTSRRITIDGRPCVQSVWREVARLREASPEVARHDALARRVIDTAPLPMGIAELREDDGDVLHLFDNPASCRSFGFEEGSTTGRWARAELGVDPRVLASWIAAYRGCQRLGRAVRFEDGRDREGDRRWLRVVVSHVGTGASGRDRFCYIAEDVTDRKRAEEEILRLNRSLERRAVELQTIFEVLPIGVGIADDPGCLSIRANPALARILRSPADANVSLTAPEPERPKSFRPFRDGRELTTDELPMQVSAKGGVSLRDVEVDVVFEDGRVTHLLEHVEPLFDEQGAPRGCVAAMIDVTERRRAESERERLLQELREADRRKDEFLAMLAHELRNPLAAAGNAAQILQLKEPDDPDVRWCCEVIDRQTRRLSRLLEDLLDVSRITRGKIVLRREVADLRVLVERAVETIRPLIEEKRHVPDVRLPAAPVWVEVDPARVEQIVVNLLANAAKYSEAGRTITIRVAREGADAVARVEDQGVGMTPEVLAKVFDLFSQAETSIDRSQGGLGIGLTIARSLAELLGGSLAARSDGVGRGSAFTLRLPVVDRAGPAADPPPPAADARATPRRIVLVDDNTDAAVALAQLLIRAGHRVETSFDGPSGLEAVARFAPEVVILDIGLPGMDGYEVAGRLRARPGGRDLFLIALTGYGQESDRRRALDAGFDRHMVKPADVDTILEVVASAPRPG